ncbi:MAG: hypothetical protein WA820_09690 [Bradyrhizobium sp.]
MALLLETLGTWLAFEPCGSCLHHLPAFCSNKKRVEQNAWRIEVGTLQSRPPSSLTVNHMDRILLSIICSGILLLVTAFSLATPGIKYIDPPREQTVLVRLMQR